MSRAQSDQKRFIFQSAKIEKESWTVSGDQLWAWRASQDLQQNMWDLHTHEHAKTEMVSDDMFSFYAVINLYFIGNLCM